MPDITLWNALLVWFMIDPAIFLSWATAIVAAGSAAAFAAWKAGVASGDRTIRERDATIQAREATIHSKDATIEGLRERLEGRKEDAERAQREQGTLTTAIAAMKEDLQRLQEAQGSTKPVIFQRLEKAAYTATVSSASLGSYIASEAQRAKTPTPRLGESMEPRAPLGKGQFIEKKEG